MLGRRDLSVTDSGFRTEWNFRRQKSCLEWSSRFAFSCARTGTVVLLVDLANSDYCGLVGEYGEK
jgi:hypothetical protein